MNVLAPWTEYFVAQAGTAAALTGLIFVALSFNLDHVIGDDTWLNRAASGLIMLAQPIVYALVCLWPTGTGTPEGWTITGLALIFSAIVTRLVLSAPSRTGTNVELVVRLVISVAQSGCTAVAGVLIAANLSAGVFVLAAGALLGLAIGLITAWALLVEVRRAAQGRSPA
jgi:hypothetical protein